MSTSSFLADYENWTAPTTRSGWRQWWTDDDRLVPLRDGTASVSPEARFAANTVPEWGVGPVLIRHPVVAKVARIHARRLAGPTLRSGDNDGRDAKERR